MAACHAVAPSWAATDWPQIVGLYDELLALIGSPVVAMNRAIAVLRVDGPLAGLAALDRIKGMGALERYPLLPGGAHPGPFGARAEVADVPPDASRIIVPPPMRRR